MRLDKDFMNRTQSVDNKGKKNDRFSYIVIETYRNMCVRTHTNTMCIKIMYFVKRLHLGTKK